MLFVPQAYGSRVDAREGWTLEAFEDWALGNLTEYCRVGRPGFANRRIQPVASPRPARRQRDGVRVLSIRLLRGRGRFDAAVA